MNNNINLLNDELFKELPLKEDKNLLNLLEAGLKGLPEPENTLMKYKVKYQTLVEIANIYVINGIVAKRRGKSNISVYQAIKEGKTVMIQSSVNDTIYVFGDKEFRENILVNVVKMLISIGCSVYLDTLENISIIRKIYV